MRAEANGRDTGSLRALDLKNLPLADARFAFRAGATETEVRFELPIEIRNSIARIEMLGEGSAGAVALLDERGKRRRVGLVFGGTTDQAQPLLAPNYYLSRALSPYAEVREGKGAVADAVAQLLNEQVSVLVFADVGALDRETLAKVTSFVEKGGVLLRFAGSRLAAGNDDLVPVRLRRGGRNLGGTLSWDTPRTFSPFTRESPFFGLDDPGRSRRAPPDPRRARRRPRREDLGGARRTARRSSRPASAARASSCSSTSPPTRPGRTCRSPACSSTCCAASSRSPARPRTSAPRRATPRPRPSPPRLVLDGFGVYISPPPTARPVSRRHAERASRRASARLLRPGRCKPRRQCARAGRQARAPRRRAAQRAGRAARRREDHRPARPAPRRPRSLRFSSTRSPRSGSAAIWRTCSARMRRAGAAAAIVLLAAALLAPPAARAQSARRIRRRRSAGGDRNRRSSRGSPMWSPATPRPTRPARPGLVGPDAGAREPHGARARRADRHRPRARRARLLSPALLADRAEPAACRARPRSAGSTPS